MRSHVCQISVRELTRATLPILAALVTLAALLRGAAFLEWLPGVPPTVHGEETTLRHQAAACFAKNPAEILLVGDSTCHAAVDARALSELLPGRPGVINLGLIISIGLDWYAQAAADFATTNPNQVKWVILLVSPSKLATRGEEHLWIPMREDARLPARGIPRRPAEPGLLGTVILRDQIASRLLPQPLRGGGAALFGFTTGLDRYMTERGGSVVDFGEFVPRPGRLATWPEESEFQGEFEEFRRRLPPRVKLAIGLTPTPMAIAPANAGELQARCVRAWNSRMRADLVLTNLPSTLPTPWFSTSGHMNAPGQRKFTEALARELSKSL